MITRLGAASRRPEMTIQQFQHHWMANHGPTAGAIPNLVRYVQHHAVLRGGRTVLPYPGFDACSELDFESIEAMDDGFARAAASGELKADEDRFVDKTRYSWILGEIDVRRPPSGSVGTTLVTWWRAHTAADPGRLLATLTGDWETAIDAAAIVERRVIVARPDWHAGRQAPTADVAEVIGFADIAAALQFLDTTAQTAGPILAGVAFGAERHLARPVVVVG